LGGDGAVQRKVLDFEGRRKKSAASSPLPFILGRGTKEKAKWHPLTGSPLWGESTSKAKIDA